MTTQEEQTPAKASSLKKRARPGEVAIRAFLFFCGFLSIVTTLGILYELGKESLLFFQDDSVSVVEFFTHTVWQPQAGVFGVLPLILGTLLISLIAILVAVPIGLAAAIYLSEYASRRVRGFFKPVLEVLVGIPTVVYGFFALTFVTPLLRSTFGGNTVSCAIGLAVLEVVQEENLQAHALTVGEHLLKGLREIRNDLIGDVRGSGLFLGVELIKDGAPATKEAHRIVNAMRDRGILIGADGPFHNVLKIRPPMPFSMSDADRLLTTLEELEQ